jgi:hypothetical protein
VVLCVVGWTDCLEVGGVVVEGIMVAMVDVKALRYGSVSGLEDGAV